MGNRGLNSAGVDYSQIGYQTLRAPVYLKQQLWKVCIEHSEIILQLRAANYFTLLQDGRTFWQTGDCSSWRHGSRELNSSVF
jgi:hypothetical protein